MTSFFPKTILLLSAGALAFSGKTLSAATAGTTSIPAVEVRPNGSGYQLYRDGEPYFIRGAGGVDHMEQLAAAGGNSVRTWGLDQTLKVLPQARRLGLTVAAGIWIEHQRHGFDYNDDAAVRAQIERHKEAIDQLRHHPEILLWSIGNEVWIQADHPRVWKVIEAVAAYARKVDPSRPVMTVLPHVSSEEVAAIQQHCPSVEILGMNSYGGINTVFADARAAGWTGPVLIAEWGTVGSWEQPATVWGAELEPTSTEKAHLFAVHYARILNEPANLGSYAFYWGQKQETTPTWFNLFLASDHPVAPVDTLTYLWTGRLPGSPSPQITPLRLNGFNPGDNLRVRPGEDLLAEFTLLKPDPESAKVRWEVRPESRMKKVGGDAEPVPAPVPLPHARALGPELFSFAAPPVPGPYRLYLYVLSDEGKAATANFPFFVDQ